MHNVQLFILAIVSLLVPSLATAAKSGHSLALTGQVRAESTNIQLIGADLTLVGPSNDTIKIKAESYRGGGTRNSRQITQTSDFHLVIPNVEPGDYLLTVEYEQYQPLLLTLNFSDLGKREFTRNIGTLYLKREMSKTLNEVSITASKVKFYNKGDTIVYNADAFNLAEGSMLDELIKQLPGVELKEGGEIYVNGRYVESLLLNGKDFFKGKNQVMLENLGAYTVKNIQVYEKETDKNRFLGQQVEENEFVMDVNLKKEYIGGWTINTEGGYGTEDRYLGRLFAMHFNATQRFTLYANANNLSDQRKPGEEDSWDPSRAQSGLLRHLEAGGDYYSEISDDGKSSVTGNLTVKQDRSHLASLSDAVRFYPSGNMSSRSDANNVSRNLSIETGHQIQVEKTNFSFKIEPTLDYSRSRSRSISRALSLNTELPADEVAEDMDKVFTHGLGSIDRSRLINATFSEAFSGSNRLRFNTRAWSMIKIPKTADFVHLFLQYSHSNDRRDSRNDYMIGYGDPTQPNLFRRQHTANRPNHSNSWIAEAFYNYQISDDWRLQLAVDTRHDRNAANSGFYMAQRIAESSGDFSLDNLVNLAEEFDPSNSYTSTELSRRYKINPSITYSKKGTFFTIDIPVAYMDRRLDYVRGGVPSPVSHRQWIIPNARASLSSYKRGDNEYSSHYYAQYEFKTELPTLRNMIDITDTTRPLDTYLGNPDLKSSLSHNFMLLYNINKRNKFDVSLRLNGSFTQDKAIQSYLYDTSTGHTTYRWTNSQVMTYSLYQHLYSSLYFGPKGCLEASVGFNASQNRDAQMIGENSLVPETYTMNNYYYTPSASLMAEIGKQRIGVFGEVQLRHSVSTRAESADINSRDFKYGFRGTFKLPYGFGISTDFSIYQRRGYDSSLLNTSDLVWNARLSKTFGKGRWMVAVDGFDLLRQLTNISYSVSASGRTERYTNTLPRYILFHVQYKINITPKKKELQSKTYRW